MTNDSAFGFDQPEDSPGFLLWQTTVTWQRLIKKALEPYNVSHTHHVIMAILLCFEEHHLDATQVLIVKWSKLDKMTISSALRKLVEAELVTRTEHELDTRAKRVSLTKKGRILAQKLVPVVEKIDAMFFGNLSAQDEKNMIKILAQLIKDSPQDEA
jgi:DNA-binding MarR family transcriptional regulator